MRNVRYLFCCILLIVISSVCSLAQVGTQGSMLGTVTDSTGAAVPGVEVVVTNLENGLSKTATTDGAGNFEIAALPVGRYSATASAKGFKSWKLETTEIT